MQCSFVGIYFSFSEIHHILWQANDKRNWLTYKLPSRMFELKLWKDNQLSILEHENQQQQQQQTKHWTSAILWHMLQTGEGSYHMFQFGQQRTYHNGRQPLELSSQTNAKHMCKICWTRTQNNSNRIGTKNAPKIQMENMNVAVSTFKTASNYEKKLERERKRKQKRERESDRNLVKQDAFIVALYATITAEKTACTTEWMI